MFVPEYVYFELGIKKLMHLGVWVWTFHILGSNSIWGCGHKMGVVPPSWEANRNGAVPTKN